MKNNKLFLAKKKTLLSATRTLLSFIRTSVVFLSLALAFIKINKERPIDAVTITLFVLSGIFLVIGIIDFFVCKNLVSNLDDEI